MFCDGYPQQVISSTRQIYQPLFIPFLPYNISLFNNAVIFSFISVKQIVIMGNSGIICIGINGEYCRYRYERLKEQSVGAAIDVVAAILINNNKILIAQRDEDDPLAGFWEFPGGKIEAGESPEQSLIREMQEEFCIDIEVKESFGSSTFQYAKGLIRLLAYICSWSGGVICSTVHHDYTWVGISELDQFNFAPADQPLVEKLIREYR
jgi:ADP-ribose pyrophosphatase